VESGKGGTGRAGWASATLARRPGFASAVERVASLVAKADLLQAGDPDAQTLEDALSLVFLDTQLEPLLDDLDDRQLRRALGRTWRKMSPNGQEAALTLALSERAVETLTRLVDGFADE